MSQRPTSHTPPARDIIIGNGTDHRARTSVVWFIDFTSQSTHRIRDVMLRTVERFGTGTTALAVRLYPQDKPGAEIAARAAIAAHAQDRYIDMHRALFACTEDFTEDLVVELAETLDLNIGQFRADLHDQQTTDRLNIDRELALASRIKHMPAVFIDGREYTGAWDEDSLIEAIEKPLGLRLQLASTEFFQWAASAGLVLILATFAALLAANLGAFDSYEHLRETRLGLSYGDNHFSLPLEKWINDGLMSLFFLLVGIEIKRELVDGELSDPARAMLPIIGAIGGMVVPAAVYIALNWGLPTQHGWGVPVATDIAFTLGIMALLGRRVPTSLKVFVSALAIADDLGAILVIAVFYGHDFDMHTFGWAIVVLVLMAGLNRGRIYARTPYLLLGIALWYFIHESGIHATLAGVLTAIAIPSRRSAKIDGIAAQTATLFDREMERAEGPVAHSTLERLQNAIDRLRDPGFHLQNALEHWSNFLILPLFAFFNTGVLIAGASFSPMAPEVLGVMAGLAIGKPLGIFLSVYLAVRFGFARLSAEINLTQILGAGCLAGVGFTMSIFIANAAFDGTQLASVKIAVLLASIVSGLAGALLLMFAARRSSTES